MTEIWTRWYDTRPTDHKAKYRWRLAESRKLLGKMLQPEWTAKLQLCGMGISNSEYWPEYSNWDGYNRTVPKDLEWRPMIEGESEETIYRGFNFLPCPFTGQQPMIKGYGGYIGAGPWIISKMSIESWLVRSSAWEDANRMEAAWNHRPEVDEKALREHLAPFWAKLCAINDTPGIVGSIAGDEMIESIISFIKKQP